MLFKIFLDHDPHSEDATKGKIVILAGLLGAKGIHSVYKKVKQKIKDRGEFFDSGLVKDSTTVL